MIEEAGMDRLPLLCFGVSFRGDPCITNLNSTCYDFVIVDNSHNAYNTLNSN